MDKKDRETIKQIRALLWEASKVREEESSLLGKAWTKLHNLAEVKNKK